MIGVIIVIIICVFITLWIFIPLCADADAWIFNKDYYKDCYSNKVAILHEIKQLRKEIAELKAMVGDNGFFKGDNK